MRDLASKGKGGGVEHAPQSARGRVRGTPRLRRGMLQLAQQLAVPADDRAAVESEGRTEWLGGWTLGLRIHGVGFGLWV